MFGVTVKVAVAAVVAAGALAGCGGGPMKMGSAALVGDDRITVSTLNQVVGDWQKQFKADPVANQMRADPSNPDQQQVVGEQLTESDMRGALHALVSFRIADEVAKRSGVAVNEGQVDRIIGSMDQQGGAGSTTLANGLPKSHTRELARFLAIRALVSQKLGADGSADSPQSAQAQERAAQMFVQTAQGMDIEINPRFGSFDATRVTINPVRYTLSGKETGIG